MFPTLTESLAARGEWVPFAHPFVGRFYVRTPNGLTYDVGRPAEPFGEDWDGSFVPASQLSYLNDAGLLTHTERLTIWEAIALFQKWFPGREVVIPNYPARRRSEDISRS